MLRLRIGVLVAVGALSAAAFLNGPLHPTPAGAAPQVGTLAFSTDLSNTYDPKGNVGIEFPGDNNGIFVSFAFSDLPPGSGLSRIVRFDGEDYNYDNDTFGHLNCCPSGGSGRYGFLIVKRAGGRGDLPGGSYDVRIYLNGTEIQHGGFGIKGTGGGDHDNRNGNDNS